jgi:hypothetical protein
MSISRFIRSADLNYAILTWHHYEKVMTLTA